MYNRYNVCAKLHAHSLFFEPMTGFEPVTSSLPRKRSTPELHRPFSFYRSWAISSKFRAGDRVRTGDIQLGRLTLYQLSYSRKKPFFKKAQNHYFNLVGRAGFEPAKVKTNRFTVCPRWPLEYLPGISSSGINSPLFLWAGGGTRTHDLLITNQLL